MSAGRSIGLDYEQLPDFLGEESRSFQAVLEADQISTPDLMDSIDSEIRDWYDAHPDGDLSTTEKALLGTARVGQKQFAYSVLTNCGFVCVFCGLGFRSAGLPSSKMLVASHIKSWRFSDSRERVDIRNGVAACPTHDAAFDSFLISATDDLHILRAESLDIAIRTDALVNRNFGPEALGATLQIVGHAKAPSPAYLSWHRAMASDLGGPLS
jgi:putative restriction endonuclease